MWEKQWEGVWREAGIFYHSNLKMTSLIDTHKSSQSCMWGVGKSLILASPRMSLQLVEPVSERF